MNYNSLLADCIFVKTEEGIYTFQSDGNSNIICGLYLISKPDYQIELEFLHFDVSCSKKGLLSVIDGWELNGQFFPGIEDHPVPRNARYHEFCGHIKPRKTFLMSQNVGLLEYRIPTAGQGFAVRVRFVQNPKRKLAPTVFASVLAIDVIAFDSLQRRHPRCLGNSHYPKLRSSGQLHSLHYL